MRRSVALKTVAVALASLLLPLLNASPAFAQVPNDDIGGALPLALDTTITQDMAEATIAPADPLTCGYPVYHTLWFSFTAAEAGPLELDPTGTTDSGTLSVLTDLGSGPAVIACGSLFASGMPGQGSGARFDAAAGQTYIVMAGGYQGGTLALTLRPGIVMTIAIDQTAAVDRQGVTVVTGTFACSRGVPYAQLDVILRQRISTRLVIEGSVTLDGLLCYLTPVPWSATIIGTNGAFRPGQAEVFITGQACDVVGCDQPLVRRIVQLRRDSGPGL
jgi:hypothetical protein